MKYADLFVITTFILLCQDIVSEPIDKSFDLACVSSKNHYREVVERIIEMPEAKSFLAEVIDSEITLSNKHLLARILSARITHAKVFSDYHEYLNDRREQMSHSLRKGQVSSWLINFSLIGPEKKVVEVFDGWESTPSGLSMQSKYKKVDKYTEEEVQAGKSRNAAARLAILEHFFKFAEEGSEHEQQELVSTVYRLWGKDGDNPGINRFNLDGIDAERLLLEVCDNENRLLSVRAEALMYLSKQEKAKRERQLMLAIAQSDALSDWNVHAIAFGQALDYLEKHQPEILKEIRSDIYWKQCMINEFLGLPLPSKAKPELKPEELQLEIR